MIKVGVMYPNASGARFDHALLPRAAHAHDEKAARRRMSLLHGGQGPRRACAGYGTRLHRQVRLCLHFRQPTAPPWAHMRKRSGPISSTTQM